VAAATIIAAAMRGSGERYVCNPVLVQAESISAVSELDTLSLTMGNNGQDILGSAEGAGSGSLSTGEMYTTDCRFADKGKHFTYTCRHTNVTVGHTCVNIGRFVSKCPKATFVPSCSFLYGNGSSSSQPFTISQPVNRVYSHGSLATNASLSSNSY
jgi:hypothetical protein